MTHMFILEYVGFKAHMTHKECLTHQDNKTMLMLFNSTDGNVIIHPPVGEPVTYWVNGTKHTIPMPDIRICNLQEELDNVSRLVACYKKSLINFHPILIIVYCILGLTKFNFLQAHIMLTSQIELTYFFDYFHMYLTGM